jgi:hypothetical protein
MIKFRNTPIRLFQVTSSKPQDVGMQKLTIKSIILPSLFPFDMIRFALTKPHRKETEMDKNTKAVVASNLTLATVMRLPSVTTGPSNVTRPPAEDEAIKQVKRIFDKITSQLKEDS